MGGEKRCVNVDAAEPREVQKLLREYFSVRNYDIRIGSERFKARKRFVAAQGFWLEDIQAEG